jgi:hypothetical protein
MATATQPSSGIPSDSDLRVIVDSTPELQGAGIMVVVGGKKRIVRYPLTQDLIVVFEFRERSAASGPVRPAKPRDNGSSPTGEWVAFGLNCGGAFLAWIGVAGTAAIAPETGGASLAGTALLWGGAVAASGQCVASVYRVTNIARGREDINKSLDENPVYAWSMRGADVVALVGAGGAIKEIWATNKALQEARVGWGKVVEGELKPYQRWRLTKKMELQGGTKRDPLAAARISAVAKQRILDLTGAAVGLVASAQSGVIYDVVVWAISGLDATDSSATE